jgi:hypothetical protein
MFSDTYKEKRVSFIVIFLMLLIFQSSLADSPAPVKHLTMAQLADKAAGHAIYITDWRHDSGQSTIKIQPDLLKNQADWLAFLTRQFSGSSAFSRKSDGIDFFLLPEGIPGTHIEAATKLSRETDFKALFQQFHQAKLVKTKDLFSIPEVAALQALSEIEKTKTIEYHRLVNPEMMTSAYSFKVKFNEALGMMVPFEKNNEPVKGQMEGFTSFSSVYHFVIDNKDQLQAHRYQQWLYLTLKDNPSSKMMLSGNETHMQAAAQYHTPEGPALGMYLSGSTSEFKTLGRIHTEETKGKIMTLSDVARAY